MKQSQTQNNSQDEVNISNTTDTTDASDSSNEELQFGPSVVFNIEIPNTDINIPITETVTVTWFLMFIISITCILVTRNFKKIPKKVQNVVELIVDSVNNFTKSSMGEDKMAFAPFAGTVIIFLGIANIVGVVGLRPPTADLNTTFAFSFITFVLIQYNAIKSNGVFNRLKSFTKPIFLFTPMNLLSEVSTPVSLAFRLFGNIVGGMIIMNLFYVLLAKLSYISVPFLQLAIPLPLHLYFDLFAGLLQSFIFTMLTLVNIAMAMD